MLIKIFLGVISWFFMQTIVVDQVLEPGIRVTVAMGTNHKFDSGNKLI